MVSVDITVHAHSLFLIVADKLQSCFWNCEKKQGYTNKNVFMYPCERARNLSLLYYSPAYLSLLIVSSLPPFPTDTPLYVIGISSVKSLQAKPILLLQPATDCCHSV